MSNTKKTQSVKSGRILLSELQHRIALEKYPLPVEFKRRPIHTQLWEDLMGSVPETWFIPAELPLIKAYIRSLAKLEAMQANLDSEHPVIEGMKGNAMANPFFSVMNQLQNSCAGMAAKLRLTPSMRFDPSRMATAKKEADDRREANRAGSRDAVQNPRAGLLFGRGTLNEEDDPVLN